MWEFNLQEQSTKQRVMLGMLQAVDELFGEEGIPYWICGGTLLGAERHGGMIPHDDDIDIETYLEHRDQIVALSEKHDFVELRKCKDYEGTPCDSLDFFGSKDLAVDVFYRKPHLPELPSFPSAAEVLPLRRTAFHNITVLAPAAPATYLSRCYDDNWETDVKVWTHHFNRLQGKAFDPDRVVVPLDQYSEVVTEYGYDAPEVLESYQDTLDDIMRPGGDLEAVLKYLDETKLMRLRMVNREEAEARERLANERG